jgi:hypothetical protein
MTFTFGASYFGFGWYSLIICDSCCLGFSIKGGPPKFRSELDLRRQTVKRNQLINSLFHVSNCFSNADAVEMIANHAR